MFEGWNEYYFMIGSSAAALIGLMFVVVALTAGRDRSETERGKHLYSSPIVWHLAVILTLSGAAIAPTITPRMFGLFAGALALLGIAIGTRSAIGIARRPGDPDSPAFDMFWYGIAPALVYAGLAAAIVGMFAGMPWATSAIAAAILTLLLVSIHAEWDLVTYLAPAADRGSKGDEP